MCTGGLAVGADLEAEVALDQFFAIRGRWWRVVNGAPKKIHFVGIH